MNTIVGIGRSTSYSANYNFIDRAYEDGYIENNTFAFQGVTEDDKYAHLTIGGYSEADLGSGIDWHIMTYDTYSWTL